MGDSISSDLIRGHIDTMILRVLSEGDNYGYEIVKSIALNSKGAYELKEPSLYTSLKRLESQGMIASYWGTKVRVAEENIIPLRKRAGRCTGVRLRNGKSPGT